MTLLIHFLMCLTTMFERGVPEEELSSMNQSSSDAGSYNEPERA
jgi:hypothetical protein